jgi:hypothetical protein
MENMDEFFLWKKKLSMVKKKIMENIDNFVSKKIKLSPLKENTWKM